MDISYIEFFNKNSLTACTLNTASISIFSCCFACVMYTSNPAAVKPFDSYPQISIIYIYVLCSREFGPTSS